MPNTNLEIARHAPCHIVVATTYTAFVLGLGYATFGFLTMLIFTAGFLGGLLLWLALPTRAIWRRVRLPFWSCMAAFAMHRVEEKVYGFFDMLSRLTDVPKPDVASPLVIGLVLVSVGGWLSTPTLMRREQPLGAYFAWTFFASMGLTELAHWLVFPFLQGDGIAAVPGMWSVLVLAPLGWWGMLRLVRG